MNGAESLVRTLVNGGVNVCFTNPGTSEMHFVAALDKVDGMRCVLGLFEGVVTGAADGYWRMKGTPAATLLHLGPGLGNGLANLHNAKKANSGIVNIVGEHATHHIKYDAPLTADIRGIAGPVSHWVRTSLDARAVAADGAEAIAMAATAPGQIATLILPGDTAWNEGNGPAAVPAVARRAPVAEEAIAQYERVLSAAPDHAGARKDLANVLVGQRRFGEATAHYQKASELAPAGDMREALAGQAAAAAHAEAGKFSQAATAIRQVLELAGVRNDPVLTHTLQSQLKLYDAADAQGAVRSTTPK